MEKAGLRRKLVSHRRFGDNFEVRGLIITHGVLRNGRAVAKTETRHARDMRPRSATQAIRASRPATVCDNIARASAPNCWQLSAAMFGAALLLLLLLRQVLRWWGKRASEQPRNGSDGLSLNLAMWITFLSGSSGSGAAKAAPQGSDMGRRADWSICFHHVKDHGILCERGRLGKRWTNGATSLRFSQDYPANEGQRGAAGRRQLRW